MLPIPDETKQTMTENAAKIILEDAHQIIKDAKDKADKIIKEAQSAKDTFIRLAIACIITIITAVSTVTVIFYIQKKQGERIDYLWKNEAPLEIVNSLLENQRYMVIDLVAQFGGDKKKAEEISFKYIEFQKKVINKLSELQGGAANITRSYHPMPEPSNGGVQ